jgi:hypothetical protein
LALEDIGLGRNSGWSETLGAAVDGDRPAFDRQKELPSPRAVKGSSLRPAKSGRKTGRLSGGCNWKCLSRQQKSPQRTT